MDLQGLLALARRRWLTIGLCLAIGIGGALLITRSTPKTYAATARLFISIPAAQGVGEALQGVELSTELIGSYAKIATSATTARATSERLDGRFSPDEVRSKVSATPVPETVLLDVTAVDVDPRSARDIANESAASLAATIDDLESTTGGGVEARIIDAASTPRGPIRPRPKVDLTIGAVAGLAVGAGLALVLESLDKSISTSEQATEAFGAPVLGVLPRQRRMATEPLVALDGTASAAGEAYRALRTSLRFLSTASPVQTVVLSSPNAGEGKTTVTANLAIAVAQAGERVIVIDADLRKSRLAGIFGVDEGPGLTSVVYGSTPLEGALREWRTNLSVLPTGELPPNPSEVLGSEGMAALLERATSLADVVIIDAPPVLPVTDAAVLAALVDGVILVARWGTTETSAAEEARFILDGVGAVVLGVALNGARGVRSGGYYRDYRPQQ